MRERTLRPTRLDNIRYICGHTGHAVLPEKYDGRAEPVSVAELMPNHPTEARRWACPACAATRTHKDVQRELRALGLRQATPQAR